jgi:hypothetical protein
MMLGLFGLVRFIAKAIETSDRGGLALVAVVAAFFVILILASLSRNPRDSR